MKALNEMLKDERMAPRAYSRLAKQLKSKRDKQIIHGIVKQERRHYRKLQLMRRRLR